MSRAAVAHARRGRSRSSSGDSSYSFPGGGGGGGADRALLSSGNPGAVGDDDDDDDAEELSIERGSARLYYVCSGPGCGRSDALFRCADCHRAFYCSRECQKKHWHDHKSKCEADKQLRLEHMNPPFSPEGDAGEDVPRPAGENRCGLCGNSPPAYPVVLNCRHAFCLLCSLRRGVEVSFGTKCATCNDRQADVSCFDLCEKHYLDRCAVNSRHKFLRSDEREAYRAKAMKGYRTLMEELGRIDPATTTLQRDDIPTLSTFRWNWKFASLVLEREDNSSSDIATCADMLREAVEKVETVVKEQLSTNQDNAAAGAAAVDEQQGLSASGHARAFKTIHESGLGCEVFMLMGDNGRAIELAEAFVALAGLYVAMGKWDDALAKYKDVDHVQQDVLGNRLWTKKQLGLLKCKLEMGEAGAVLNLKSDTLKINDCSQGVHMPFALAHRKRAETCRIEDKEDHLLRAMRVMKDAIYTEAPWDKENRRANQTAWYGFYEALKLERERKRREKVFLHKWGRLIDKVKAEVSKDESERLVSWASLKAKRFDMFNDEDPALEEERAAAENRDIKVQASIQATSVEAEDDVANAEGSTAAGTSAGFGEGDENENIIENKEGKTMLMEEAPVEFHRFKLTKEVRKWWTSQGDPKYKEFFVRRLKQLARGDRSRILQKRLTGSKNVTIFETYLEQKSGFRILWTEDSSGILIWYVSPHDRVSTHMKRIDDAQSRSRRQLKDQPEHGQFQDRLHAIADVPELADALDQAVNANSEGDDDLDADRVLLDPYGDIPMKLYMLRDDEIDRFASTDWLPPLYLTTEEKRIVQKEGTVLLLGRSGTGKTVCICNRIHFDRHLGEENTTFSQVFVARSQRICNYVRETVGPNTRIGGLDDSTPLTTYFTFSKFVENCESVLFDKQSQFDARNRVDFARFKKQFTPDSGMDHLIIWTQIQSFIKGSIETLTIESESKQKGEPLERDHYLDNTIMGSRRCRLSTEERNAAYNDYEKYKKWLDEEKLFDGSDRKCSLLLIGENHFNPYNLTRHCVHPDLCIAEGINRLVQTIMRDRDGREKLSRSRVYVDEIQDYTQLEIALFFLLCSHGGLFLAGDPAQSVVEGVEFRFEEVRSVPYHLFPGDKRFIPEKPLTVTRNFRSHAGILKIAGEVLDKLFVNFPGSAKELPKDKGLFVGPRPAIFQNIGDREDLKNLVYKIQGIVVLAMRDDEVLQLQELLGKEIVVLSIRDSKGLEFPDVMIVNFFCSLPQEHQKAWKLMMKGSEDAQTQPGFPEIETHLKQLYTAITRCSKRLFFVETEDSDSGREFVRELTKKRDEPLLVKQDVADTELIIKTQDEWNAIGVERAFNGESADDLVRAKFWLVRAMAAFENSKEADLQQKVNAHMKSIETREKYQYLSSADVQEDRKQLENDLYCQLKELNDVGLLVEARQLCEVMLPLLENHTQALISERLMPLLLKAD